MPIYDYKFLGPDEIRTLLGNKNDVPLQLQGSFYLPTFSTPALLSWSSRYCFTLPHNPCNLSLHFSYYRITSPLIYCTKENTHDFVQRPWYSGRIIGLKVLYSILISDKLLKSVKCYYILYRFTSHHSCSSELSCCYRSHSRCRTSLSAVKMYQSSQKYECATAKSL